MVRLDDILEKILSFNSDADLDAVRKAYVFSAKVHQGQVRLSGEPYLTHPMEVAYILVQLKMDVPTIVAGLLHDTLEDTLTTIEELHTVFGKEVAGLVDGITKIGKITFRTREERQAENFRKMLLAMARDIRVILVKLADRLHNMRTLHFQPEARQRKIAQETLDIYAPLANRLGISWIKGELEDLAFRYLQPEIFYDLVAKVAKRKKEREQYIEEVKNQIRNKLQEHDIEGEVSGPLQASLFHLPQDGAAGDRFRSGLRPDRFSHHRRIGARVLRRAGDDSSTWKPIPGRFKDYIAMPKANHVSVAAHDGDRSVRGADGGPDPHR